MSEAAETRAVASLIIDGSDTELFFDNSRFSYIDGDFRFQGVEVKPGLGTFVGVKDLTNAYVGLETGTPLIADDLIDDVSLRAGAVLDSGDIEPFFEVEFNEDISQELGIDHDPVLGVLNQASVSLQGAVWPGEVDESHIVSSLRAGYNNSSPEAGEIINSWAEIYGGAHSDRSSFAGAEFGGGVGLLGNPKNLLYAFGKAGVTQMFDTKLGQNISLQAGLGLERDYESVFGSTGSYKNPYNRVRFEVYGQHNSEEPLPDNVRGPSGVKGFSAGINVICDFEP